MRVSYLRYAMSVIVARALPDVRDGLKPSQRRVLVTLNDLGLTPRAKYRKCAKIVGDTTGNYHPHGGDAVYMTMVRMAQKFSMRYPLVDGQGNFGSVDGDPPAAMRYTEARMGEATVDMLADLDMDTVDFQPNYEETREEPVVLPACFPNLLCNGAAGIAVGVATNIPPHNLGEVCDALLHLIDHPDCTVDELMLFVKGPDFPTGGIICGREGILGGFHRGRGRLIVRSRFHVEDVKNGRRQIVFTEIPYQVNKVTIIEKIVECVKEDRIEGISDVTDESDKDGMRLIVELKKGEDENQVVNQLFKFTPLQDIFSINSIALVEGKPRRLDLKEFLVYYRDHRREILRRRTHFLLDKAEKRAHILEGLRIAIDNLDAVIALIRSAPDVESARAGLVQRFALSLAQASAILEMQLRRLTGLERGKLDDEYRELLVKIADYKDILARAERILGLLRDELRALKERFASPRRTEIGSAVEDFMDEDLIPDEKVALLLSHRGYMKRLSLDEFRTQGRGGKGVTGMNTKEDDFTEFLIAASSKDYLLLFTNLGRVYWIKAYEIPEMGRASQGRAVVNLLSVEAGERILTAIPVNAFDDRELVMATARGTIKKTALEAYSHPKKTGILAIVLEDGDSLIDVSLVTGDKEDIVLTTAQGLSIRFPERECRSMGRVSRGVQGITLGEGDRVVSMNLLEKGATILTLCENGYGKKSDFDAYRVTHRGGKGVKTISNMERNGPVVRSLTVHEEDEVLLLTNQGMMLRFPTSDLRVLGRATGGVRLMRMEEGDKVEAVVRLPRMEGNGAENGGGKPVGVDEPQAVAGGENPEGEGVNPEDGESKEDEKG